MRKKAAKAEAREVHKNEGDMSYEDVVSGKSPKDEYDGEVIDMFPADYDGSVKSTCCGSNDDDVSSKISKGKKKRELAKEEDTGGGFLGYFRNIKPLPLVFLFMICGVRSERNNQALRCIALRSIA